MRIQAAWFGKRALSFAALGSLIAACGGSVVLEEGAAGSGGDGGGGGMSSTSDNGTTGPGPSTVVSSGSGTGTCLRCAEYISQGMGTLCPESEKIFNVFLSCVCAESCIPQCSSNVCSGSNASDDCVGCINKLCVEQFNQCANDI